MLICIFWAGFYFVAAMFSLQLHLISCDTALDYIALTKQRGIFLTSQEIWKEATLGIGSAGVKTNLRFSGYFHHSYNMATAAPAIIYTVKQKKQGQRRPALTKSSSVDFPAVST